MESVVNIASYIIRRYQDEFGSPISEMKLHKLLYFTQRESIIQTGEPMFPESFHAWKYGPVQKEIRIAYRVGLLDKMPPSESIIAYTSVFDKVFSQYAHKDPWSLSRLSHGETSWINARKGLGPVDHCENELSIDDIRKDAERIKLRRLMIGYMSLT